MAMYREVISDGDLVLQRCRSWLFGQWDNWRNLDEELRALKEHEAAAYKHFKDVQRLRVLAQGNVKERKDLLGVYKLENSEAAFNIDVETSILEEREGVKYPWPNQNNQQGKGNKQKNNNGNNNQGGNNQQKGGHNKPSSNGRKDNQKAGGAMNATIVFH